MYESKEERIERLERQVEVITKFLRSAIDESFGVFATDRFTLELEKAYQGV